MSSMICPKDLEYARSRCPSEIVAAQPAAFGEDGRRHPHVTRFRLRNGSFMDVFHSKPIYYERKDGAWRPLSEIATHYGNRRIALHPKAMGICSWHYLSWLMRRQRSLGSRLEFRYAGGLLYAGVTPYDLAAALTLTKNPDADPETSTVDGSVNYVATGGETFATVHDAADGTASVNSGATGIPACQLLAGNYTIRRIFALYDTSALGASASISAGVMSSYVNSKVNLDNDGDDWINIVQSNPASNTNLVVGDYDQCGDAVSNPTEGATRIDIGSITTSAYNDWTLNATGLGWISKTGITKLGMREGHDAINSAPASVNSITIRLAEDTNGTPQKLVVTYTLPATPIPVFMHHYMQQGAA